MAGVWTNSGSTPVGDGRERSGIPDIFRVLIWKRLVRLQASCGVSVTNLAECKSWKNDRNVRRLSCSTQLNCVLPGVLLCLIKLILGLILPCLAALPSWEKGKRVTGTETGLADKTWRVALVTQSWGCDLFIRLLFCWLSSGNGTKN